MSFQIEQPSEKLVKPIVNDARDSMVSQYMDSKPGAYADKLAELKGYGMGTAGSLPPLEIVGEKKSKCDENTKCMVNPAEMNSLTWTKPHKLNDDGLRPEKPHPIFKDVDGKFVGKELKKVEPKDEKFVDKKGFGDKNQKELSPKEEAIIEAKLAALKAELIAAAGKKPQQEFTPEQRAAMEAKKREMARQYDLEHPNHTHHTTHRSSHARH
ncbi:MAG: hypothetical protein JSS83_25075 [Cyanobacteria bacterium SZAS LIN-3]|nr:hypothetical protein [Cyanobacteria bacterium SZAS LIN-3]